METLVPPLNIPKEPIDEGTIQSAPRKKVNPFSFPPETQRFTYREEQLTRARQEKVAYNKLTLLQRQKLIKPSIPAEYTHASIQLTKSRQKKIQVSAPTTARSPSPKKLEGDNSQSISPPLTTRERPMRVDDLIIDKREIYLVSLVTARREKEIHRLQNEQDREEEALAKALNEIEKTSVTYKNLTSKLEQEITSSRKAAETAALNKIKINKEVKAEKINIALLNSEIIKNEEFLHNYQEYNNILHYIKPEDMNFEEFLKNPALLNTQLNNLESDNLFLARQCDNLQEILNRKQLQTKTQFQMVEDNFQEVLQRLHKSPVSAFLNSTYRTNEPESIDNNTINSNFSSNFNSNFNSNYYGDDDETILKSPKSPGNNTRTITSDRLSQSFSIHEPDSDYDSPNVRSLTKTLTRGIENVALSLDSHDEECNAIEKSIQQNTIFGNDELSQVNQLVLKCYKACFGNVANVSTLSMLEILENSLENSYLTVKEFDSAWVSSKQSKKDNARREIARKLKQQLQEKEQQAKIDLALKRATMPIKKRNGRPLYKRSLLEHHSNKNDEQLKAEREEEERINKLLYGDINDN